jgi:hypothetical protein
MDYGDRRMRTGTDDELLEIGYAAYGVLKTHPVSAPPFRRYSRQRANPRSSRHSRSCGNPC